VVVMVSYQRRFDPAYGYMRRVIADGELGELRTITVTCAQGWRKGTAGKWRQDPALSGGGMLMDSGSHLVDMLLWLVDQPVVSVAAVVDNLDTPVDINSATTVCFAGGTQGQLTVNGDLPATWIESVLIVGSTGVLRYETEPQHPWRTGRLLHYRDGGILQPLPLPPGSPPDAGWLEAIRGRGENPAPPEVGVKVAEFTAAIYQSAQEGTVVLVSSQPSGRPG
ncbi:MAG: Gfo/Idh/MocA family oxidoreductase, partial [Chloroflexota bacterium]|nr:Gfo/Idh/MocA family oxidoreductase [Chloroflexota bacterium]